MNEEMKSRKGLYVLLAILVAISIWIYEDEIGTTGVPNQVETTITDIPIIYTGEEDLAERGLMMLPEETTETMDLTITGGRRQVAHFSRDNIRVTVNLDYVEHDGVQMVSYSSVTSSNRRFSQSMITVRTPNMPTVNIKELNRKTVDVRCDLVGNLADGYTAGELVLSQTTVELQGQAVDVDPISYAKVTLNIGNQATESVSQELKLELYDASNQLVSNSNVRLMDETVQATLPVFVTKELQLIVDFKEADGLKKSNLDYEIKPSTIMVSGDASKLKNVKSIVLGEFELLDLLASGTSSHTYPIMIPDGCQNLSGVTRATLEVKFKDLERTQVVTDQFQFVNAPSGKHVDILSDSMTVSIYGTAEDVAAVTGSDLTIQVDLSNYTAASGTYTMPVTILENAEGDIGISGSYHLQFTIRDAEDVPEDIESSGMSGTESAE